MVHLIEWIWIHFKGAALNNKAIIRHWVVFSRNSQVVKLFGSTVFYNPNEDTRRGTEISTFAERCNKSEVQRC